MHFTAKLKNTGTCAAVFSTCSADGHSIMLKSGTGVGTGVGVGTGTGVGVEDLELSITPQRVSIISTLFFASLLSKKANNNDWFYIIHYFLHNYQIQIIFSFLFLLSR